MNNVIIETEPKWVKKKDVLKMFNIGFRKLDYWTSCGYIRTVKFDGGSQQGARLYYAPDIEELLLKLSAGHSLVPKIGRVKP